MKKILAVILAVAALSACTKEPGYVIKGQKLLLNLVRHRNKIKCTIL